MIFEKDNIFMAVGDSLELLKGLEENSIDAIVCDPPYGLGFMGKEWDTFDKSQFGLAGNEGENDLKVKKNFTALPRIGSGKELQDFTYKWAVEALRVLKPGGHLLSFGGTRTYHRMTCAIEDAGFEIRDCIFWVYGSGFPKSLNIGKAVDKLQGNEREVVGRYVRPDGSMRINTEKHSGTSFDCGSNDKDLTKGNSKWEGYGSALKPAVESIVLARKTLSEKTIAENVLKWGTGALNIDGCRISYGGETPSVGGRGKHTRGEGYGFKPLGDDASANQKGRFPANLVLSCECENTNSTIPKKEPYCYQEKEYNVEGFVPHIKPKSPSNYNDTDVKFEGHSDDCPVSMFPDSKGAGNSLPNVKVTGYGEIIGMGKYDYKGGSRIPFNCGSGSAARFFYCAKSSKKEKEEGLLGHLPCVKCGSLTSTEHEIGGVKGKCFRNDHPTVKPVNLMKYLITLVNPPGDSIILDPFMGSGTTGVACVQLNCSFIGFDKDEHYFNIAKARVENQQEIKKNTRHFQGFLVYIVWKGNYDDVFKTDYIRFSMS